MREMGRSARELLLPTLLVGLGLVMRLAVAIPWNARHGDGESRLRYGDEPSYDAPARAILDGVWFENPDRLPLYPMWLAFWHAVTGSNYDAVVYAQCLLGAAAVLVTYALGLRVADRTSAAIAAGAVAVSPVLVQQVQYFIPEILFTLVLALVALTLVRAWQAPTVRRFVVAGLLVGVANLIRPTLLFFPVFVAAALLLAARGRAGSVRHAAAYMLAAYLVTTPWTIRNYVVHDTFLPLSTSNATLWIGSPEYHRLIHDQGYTYTRVWDEVIYPDDPAVPYPTTIEGERYWSDRAMRSIKADPLLYSRLVLERLGTYWVGDPVVDWGGHRPLSYAHLRRYMEPRAAVIRLAERAVPILAALAIVVLWRRRRELLPLYVLLLYTTLLHAATVARVRMSDPFRPILYLLVAAALVELIAARRARRREGASAPSNALSEASSA